MRRLAAVCALAWVSAGTAAPTVNMAFNGGFELDANRDGQPDGWRPVVFRSPAKTRWDRQAARSGLASVCVENSAHPTDRAWDANSGRWVQTSATEVDGGQPYSLSGWIKTDLTAGQATLTFAWFRGGKWLHEDSCTPVTGRSDWTHRQLTVQAPARADRVAAYLILSAGRGRAWFDEVRMVRGNRCPDNLRPLDIRSACTTGFRDETPGDGRGGWTDQGDNDARSLLPGTHTWRGIPFRIIDPKANGGRACVVLRGRGRPDMPAEVSITVARKAEVIYFLHGCAWAGRKGRIAAQCEITYRDGQRRSMVFRVGGEAVDWWRPRDTDESVTGWRGRNPQSNSVGLNIFPWVNPRPEIAIDHITIQSAGNGSLYLLAAVTTGDGPPAFEKEPTYMEFTDTSDWHPWAFDLGSPTLGEIDLRPLLDAPAGKHGFVTIGDDGHFHLGNGQRIRFFGTDIGGRSCCPEKKTAEVTAERLARFGVNLVRLHAPDSRWAKFIDYESGNTRSIKPEAFDRYDYFVYQLKQHGIYVYFDLLDYRQFLPGDGVRDADKMDTHWEHSIKGASIFDRRMIELQKEFATQLLTHRNPYTGLRYVDEPALAVQEITNENSLFYLANTKLMLPSYMNDLRRLWNRWLVEKYGDRRKLARAWTNEAGQCALLPDEDPERGTVLLPVEHLYADLAEAPFTGPKSPVRMNAIQRFLYELEVTYYDEMIGHLRAIGLKCPITGTNQDFSAASNRANARCDFMARNNYWCHPNVHSKPMQFRNEAIVKSDLWRQMSVVANVASSAVVAKPLISPEFNCPWPNEWRAECLPLMASYACLQDWDGLLFFAYHPDRPGRKTLTSFGTQSDPVHWGQIPLAALIFHRGDVSVARQTVHVGIPDVDCFTTQARRTDGRNPYALAAYVSKVRNAYFERVYHGDADLVIPFHPGHGDYSAAKRVEALEAWKQRVFDGHRLRSDTRELSLDTEAGLFTAVTQRAVIATGFLGAQGEVNLGAVRVRCRTPFASVSLVSLDVDPLSQSRCILLTAVARSENSGQALAANAPTEAKAAVDADTGALLRIGRHALAEPGRLPVLMEPVDAEVRLTTGRSLQAFVLSPVGTRERELPVRIENGAVTVATREAMSPWVLLVSGD